MPTLTLSALKELLPADGEDSKLTTNLSPPFSEESRSVTVEAPTPEPPSSTILGLLSELPSTSEPPPTSQEAQDVRAQAPLTRGVQTIALSKTNIRQEFYQAYHEASGRSFWVRGYFFGGGGHYEWRYLQRRYGDDPNPVDELLELYRDDNDPDSTTDRDGSTETEQ